MREQTRFAIVSTAYGVGMVLVGVGLGLLFLTQTQIDWVIHRLLSPMLVVGIFGAVLGVIAGIRGARILSKSESQLRFIPHYSVREMDSKSEYRTLFYVMCVLVLGFVLWNEILTQDLAQMASHSMLVLIPFGVFVSVLFGISVVWLLVYRLWSK